MTRKPVAPEDRLLTPPEVADLFRVKTVTVARWARAGKLDCLWTDVLAFLDSGDAA